MHHTEMGHGAMGHGGPPPMLPMCSMNVRTHTPSAIKNEPGANYIHRCCLPGIPGTSASFSAGGTFKLPAV